MIAWRNLAAALLLLGSVAAGAMHEAGAQEAQLADPTLEQRARDLAREIRCVVCQAQSIADSDADIARDMRGLIREQIAEGKSDQEIRDYLVARYGDFVLFEPPFKPSTYVLWIGPFALLVVALAGAIFYFRRPNAAAAGLSAAEEKRVAELLRGEEGRDEGRGEGA